MWKCAREVLVGGWGGAAFVIGRIVGNAGLGAGRMERRWHGVGRRKGHRSLALRGSAATQRRCGGLCGGPSSRRALLSLTGVDTNRGYGVAGSGQEWEKLPRGGCGLWQNGGGEVAIATKQGDGVAGRGQERRNCHTEGADCGRTEEARWRLPRNRAGVWRKSGIFCIFAG